MAITVSMTQVQQAFGDSATNFTVTVANGNASAVTLNSLAINGPPASGVVVQQPNYLTPNVPVGVGNPVIAAGSSLTWGFQVVLTNPNFPGPSPNNQPGGAAGSGNAMPANSNFLLQAIGQTSDGSVFSSTNLVPVLSAVAPFPFPQGGAFQFNDGFDFMNLIMLGAL